jgi:hypothetical protein
MREKEKPERWEREIGEEEERCGREKKNQRNVWWGGERERKKKLNTKVKIKNIILMI